MGWGAGEGGEESVGRGEGVLWPDCLCECELQLSSPPPPTHTFNTCSCAVSFPLSQLPSCLL